MEKIDVIKKAYGEHWDICKGFLDPDGWCDKSRLFKYSNLKYSDIEANMQHKISSEEMRPKSLQGIENNNGWVRIESESDLPKEDCRVDLLSHTGSEYYNHTYSTSDNPAHYLKFYSHYSTVQKRPLPHF